MASIHKSTNYGKLTAEIKNPFLTGQDKAFAEILLDKQAEVSKWRIASIGVVAIGILNLILFFSAIRMQKTVPVLINVMPTGEAQYLGEVRGGTGVVPVPESAIVFQVREFIILLRSISTDYDVLYNNISKCYSLVTSNYGNIMTNNLRNNSPFDLVGKTRRTIVIESVIKITASSYQADWIETSLQGSSKSEVKMRAIITVKQLPVSNDTIKNNPLGIYIDNFEMVSL